MVAMFAAGAELTAASKGVAVRAHTLTLQLAMSDPEKAHVGELFERQVAAAHCPAFESAGIQITRSPRPACGRRGRRPQLESREDALQR